MRRLTGTLLAIVLAGCGSSAADLTLAPTDTTVAGTFNLTTANGIELPIVATRTLSEEYDLAGDQLVLDASGTWTETTSYTVIELNDNSQSTTTSVTSGTYSISNKQIVFVRTVGGAATFTGSVTGNVLSLLYNGGHFLYTR